MWFAAKHRWLRPLTRRWPMLTRLSLQLIVAAVLLFLCALVYWHIEPSTPTLGQSLWLAFVTASTVGYGDVVPSTAASRLFSILVVLLGFGVLSLVTAAIAATFVETRERRIEREILHDLHRQIALLHADLKALREEVEKRNAP